MTRRKFTDRDFMQLYAERTLMRSFRAAAIAKHGDAKNAQDVLRDFMQSFVSEVQS